MSTETLASVKITTYIGTLVSKAIRSLEEKTRKELFLVLGSENSKDIGADAQKYVEGKEAQFNWSTLLTQETFRTQFGSIVRLIDVKKVGNEST